MKRQRPKHLRSEHQHSFEVWATRADMMRLKRLQPKHMDNCWCVIGPVAVESDSGVSSGHEANPAAPGKEHVGAEGQQKGHARKPDA